MAAIANVPYGMLSTDEVASRLGVTVNRVTQYCRAGQIKATNLSDGKKNAIWYIREDDFKDFAANYKWHKKMPKIANNEIKLSLPPVEEPVKQVEESELDFGSIEKMIAMAKRATQSEAELKDLKARLKEASDKAMELALMLESLAN